MIETEKFTKIEIDSSKQLRDWLEVNHLQSESIWLITYKKSVPEKYVSTSEVLDELLCFGWIDGIRRKLDERRTMQLISPRRVNHWAKTYKERVERLIREGKMQASGLRTIEIAKRSGLWDLMDDVDKLILPPDLLKALSKNENAFNFFTSINESSKRFVLRWIKLAKTEKTRKSRIEKIVQLSIKGQKLEGS